MSRPYGDTSQLLTGRISRAHRCARSHRISFGVQGRPSSAGRQSQVRRDARICFLYSRGGKHKRNKGSCPTLGPAAHSSWWPAGRYPAPCLPVALPQPGKVSSEPARPFPVPAAATVPLVEGSGPAGPGAADPHPCKVAQGPAAKPALFTAYSGDRQHC